MQNRDDQTLDWLKENWSSVVSVIGLIVSVGGFSIAIWQIVNARRSVEAAAVAIRETRERLSRNTTISDLRRASNQIQRIKDLHIERQWRTALDRYYDVRVMIADIRLSYPQLDDEQKSNPQQAIGQVSSLERTVRQSIHEQSEPLDLRRYDSALSRTQNILDELASILTQNVS